MKNFIITALILLLFSCDRQSGEGENDDSLLPPSSGRSGEIILVIDSTLYHHHVGDALNNALRGEMVGLPREEPYFKMNQIEPDEFNSVLKTVKNLIFVMTLDNKSQGNRRVRQYFTENSIKQIEEQPELFMFSSKNVYAKGQQVLYLFSASGDSLAQKIAENEEKIRAVFNTAERQRLEKGLYKAKVSEELSKQLVKKHNFFMKIPFGYKTVENSNNFVWFRQINDESDKNIFITYKPYINENQVEKQKIIELRDSIAREKLFEDPEVSNTYLITETGVPYKPVVTKQMTLNGHYAIETRGLWRTKTATMGGPFLSYTVVDEKAGRIYYIEGFLYSPGKPQREFMRELEVILHTFEPRS